MKLREKILDAITSSLTDHYWCDRVWEAWEYGTMTADDFYPAEDGGMVPALVDEILGIVQTPKHETISQWEDRTGEKFKHDSLVYVLVDEKDGVAWKFMRYRKAINLDYMDDYIIVVKENHGKPEEE